MQKALLDRKGRGGGCSEVSFLTAFESFCLAKGKFSVRRKVQKVFELAALRDLGTPPAKVSAEMLTSSHRGKKELSGDA